jgi:site-specific recombinase XerD
MERTEDSNSSESTLRFGSFILEEWLRVREELGFDPTHPVFCTRHGTAVKGAYVRWLLPRLAEKAGILKRVHAHGLRHTHAYELAMEGVPMPIIQRQLGHRNLSTTNTYLSHSAPTKVIETIGAREWRP